MDLFIIKVKSYSGGSMFIVWGKFKAFGGDQKILWRKWAYLCKKSTHLWGNNKWSCFCAIFIDSEYISVHLHTTYLILFYVCMIIVSNKNLMHCIGTPAYNTHIHYLYALYVCVTNMKRQPLNTCMIVNLKINFWH